MGVLAQRVDISKKRRSILGREGGVGAELNMVSGKNMQTRHMGVVFFDLRCSFDMTAARNLFLFGQCSLIGNFSDFHVS